VRRSSIVVAQVAEGTDDDGLLPLDGEPARVDGAQRALEFPAKHKRAVEFQSFHTSWPFLIARVPNTRRRLEDTNAYAASRNVTVPSRRRAASLHTIVCNSWETSIVYIIVYLINI
jgi:hypothetical protein